MNAFDIYAAAFDSAQIDNVPDERRALVDYVDDYAFNALEKSVSISIAEQIADAYLHYKLAVDAGDMCDNLFWHNVRKPLLALSV